ncbi:hypothetical protein G4B88_012110, partial [Cannabis sativa]
MYKLYSHKDAFMLSRFEKSLLFNMLKKPVETMDDLLAKASNFTVLDEDGWESNAAGSSVVGEHCAKARICSNRPMSRPLLKTILGRVWGIADNNWGVEIKFNNNHSSFLVFSFKSAEDLNRILNKSPWFLNYGTLILERMVNLPCDWEQELLRFPIIGRVLHLPSCSITKGNLVRLATMAGEVIEVDDKRDTKTQKNAAMDPPIKTTCGTGSFVQESPIPTVLSQDQGQGGYPIHSSTSKHMLELSSGLACTDTNKTALFEKEVEGMKAKIQGHSETMNVNSKRMGLWGEDSSNHQRATAMDME